jgi:hypothetical protein
MLIKNMSMTNLGKMFWKMHGKVTIVVCLPMGKQEQENHILW